MIDYAKIAHAVKHYSDLGYEYIDVPWLVDIDSVLITRPPKVRLFSTFMGELVASGEQSFYDMRKDLQPGKRYQCVTPCFRDDNYDELHFPYFMKNELIFIGIDHDMIYGAEAFFKSYSDNVTIANVPLPNAMSNRDIFINGVEVGSYGVRSMNGFTWTYGTGCAEPRLSQSLRIIKR